MAKRFADTKLSREKWFRLLKPSHKCAVRYLFDECDEAGVWPIDDDAMEFHIGERVEIADLFKSVNADGKLRLRVLGGNKIYIPNFAPFQYGRLSEACKPHQKPIARLRELNLWEEYLESLRYPLQRVKEEEEDKEEDKEEEGEEGIERVRTLRSRIDTACEEWKKTLKHFGADHNLSALELAEIGRAIQDKRIGYDAVMLALAGPRAEKKTDKYDPADFLSLARVFDLEKIERLMNIGAKAKNAAEAAAIKEQRAIGVLPVEHTPAPAGWRDGTNLPGRRSS